MELKPIKSRKIYEEIVQQIKELIANGSLKPGDRLLAERQLAERLKVSRVSVREALRTLEIMGFIETRTGGGSYVKESRTDEIVNCLAMFITAERDSLREVFEVRKIFETASARLAAQRATAADIARIQDYLEKMKNAYSLEDSEKGMDFDLQFHFAIAEASHNRWLMRLLHTISDSYNKTVSAARQQLHLSAKTAKKITEQHNKIFKAILDKDSELAEKHMLEHLQMAESSVDAVMKELKSKPTKSKSPLKAG